MLMLSLFAGIVVLWIWLIVLKYANVDYVEKVGRMETDILDKVLFGLLMRFPFHGVLVK